MDMNSRFFCSLCLLFFSLCTTLSAQTPFSYHTGFETKADTAGWTLKSRSAPYAQWCWGTASSRNGDRSFYISADTGKTVGYLETPTGYYTVAYRRFSLPQGKYDLAFDLKAGGEMSKNKDPFDALKVAWVPVSFLPEPNAGTMGKYPMYATMYGFSSEAGETEFLDTPWRTVTGQLNVTDPSGEYWLIFIWKANGGFIYNAPGASIDNVSLRSSLRGTCAQMPSSLTETKDPVTSEKTISWTASADSYQLHLFGHDINGTFHDDTISGITATSYRLTFSSLPEGVYSVKVRSICGTDTSLWNGLPNVLMYDPDKHCIDYIDLTDPSVVATSGNFSRPYRDIGVVDKGSRSQFSIHTVHHDPDEYDIRTGFQLKTVPDGAVASVRISNWMEEPSPSGSITYDYTVTEEADVFQIRYAAVLQYQERHSEAEQTRIIVEILDAGSGNRLSECTYSDFNAKQVNNAGDIRNWHKYTPPAHLLVDESCPIMWCDWTPIGINLGDYIGLSLKIKITMKACAADVHFAYAYFVLECSKGEIDGIACGEHPEVFRVPKGFKYKWYKTTDPDRVTLSTADTLEIAPTDTATYSVDLINPDAPECVFTLKASALPRKPISTMTYNLSVDDCTQSLQFTNTSRVFGFWQGDTIPTDQPTAACEWDFGKYGTSPDPNPILQNVPLQGDTFTVTLRTSVDKNWGCFDEKQYLVQVPSIAIPPHNVEYLICEGSSVTHDTITYDRPGDYTITYRAANGCDSIVNVKITTLVADTLTHADTICTGDTYDFYGRPLTQPGHYADTIPSTAGCDSIIRTLDLTVNTSLALTLDASTVITCADSDTCHLTITHTAGHISHYYIEFDTLALSAGFLPIDAPLATPDPITIPIPLPDTITPDHYHAAITLFNSECGDTTLPFTIEVRYPKTIITQRWDDVLALYNDRYNGGYDFITYQWYKDGTPLEGEIRSILYQPSLLDFSAEYTLMLTRLSDGKTIMTCPFVPQPLTDGQQSAMAVIFGDDATTIVQVPQPAQAHIYDPSGILHATLTLHPGDNPLPTTLPPGIYLLRIHYTTGATELHKIIK